MNIGVNSCRICLKLKKPKKMKPLFTQKQNPSIVDVVFDVTGVKIENDPNLPSHVCSRCLENIETARNLRTLVVESDKYLKKILHDKKGGKSSTSTQIIKAEPAESDLSDIANDYIISDSENIKYEVELEDGQGSTIIVTEQLKDDFIENIIEEEYEVEIQAEPIPEKKPVKMEETLYPAYDTEVRYQCTICGYLLRTKNGLRNHEKIHTTVHYPKFIKNPFYICDFCGKTFAKKGYIYSHLYSVHVRGKQSWTCQFCNKFFYKKPIYTSHVNSHLDIRNFKCDVCQKAFIKKKDLSVHMRIHNGSRPYKCQYCEKDYIHYTDLKRHTMGVHTLERPYQCKLCDKGYVKRSCLQAHERTHGVVSITPAYTTQPVKKFSLQVECVPPPIEN